MEELVPGAYMVCAILFILSLGGLSSQETAMKGNIYGIIAMGAAIIATFFHDAFDYRFETFLPAFFLGAVIGLGAAIKVDMISMPQMVAALHSFVGLAAVLVGFGSYFHDEDKSALAVIESTAGIFIGAVTFTGSIVAWGKLQGVVRSAPLIIGGNFRHFLNLLVILGCLALAILYGFEDDQMIAFGYLLGLSGLAFFLGWHLVMAIGGADMPVVVSMLNSYSGWATAASGFLLENQLLVISGALIGASGAILSYIMCKAMNRSFISVIAGGWGETDFKADDDRYAGMEPSSIPLDILVRQLKEAKSVIIVPGYGMAAARCQHDVGTLAAFLKKLGKKVRFCIHPVAGRLPGHMNVLLAEASVDYKMMLELEEINEDFHRTDVVLVIGANDIVNPDAIENPKSLIAGMPVCEVWHSKLVVIFKRGKGTGYAGIENPLFFKENSKMFYGNADKSVKDILNLLTQTAVEVRDTDDEAEKSDEESQEKTVDISSLPEPKMTLGVPKEVLDKENRVAITPTTVIKFRTLGFKVVVESSAGDNASYNNDMYTSHGAVIGSTSEVWSCDIVLKIRKPTAEEDDLLSNVKCLVSYMAPSQNMQWLSDLSHRYPNLTCIAMDAVPRTTRAQKVDSLSSMANIAGYRAVIEAFNYFQRCPKPMSTAAGKLPPAKVLVIGAGVAGLSAIGYAKSLGCIVYAMDSREAACKDAESMGAEIVKVKVKEEGSGSGGYAKVMSQAYSIAQQETIAKLAKKLDIIISTALIPGRTAPILITQEAVTNLKSGSVIVDMAAENGGNCTLTRKDEAYIDPKSGVTLLGFTDLNSRMAPQSSELYSNNLYHLLNEMGGASKYNINLNNDILKEMVVLSNSKVTWIPYDQRPAPTPAPQAQAKPTQEDLSPLSDSPKPSSKLKTLDWFLISLLLICLFVGLSYATYSSFMNLMMSFVLAIFIGYMVIWNVTPSLHTPLMSVTNAISGIIVIGAMLILDGDDFLDAGSSLGMVAVFFASINIWGGFLVTYRMLRMFKTDN